MPRAMQDVPEALQSLVMSTVRQFPPSESLTSSVAEEVRALMGRRIVTQKQLADVLQVSQGQVSKRLKGSIPFDTNEIEKLSHYFGVHPAELMGGAAPSTHGPEPTHRTTDRYPRNVVTLREVFTIKPLPAQIVRAAA